MGDLGNEDHHRLCGETHVPRTYDKDCSSAVMLVLIFSIVVGLQTRLSDSHPCG